MKNLQIKGGGIIVELKPQSRVKLEVQYLGGNWIILNSIGGVKMVRRGRSGRLLLLTLAARGTEKRLAILSIYLSNNVYEVLLSKL